MTPPQYIELLARPLTHQTCPLVAPTAVIVVRKRWVWRNTLPSGMRRSHSLADWDAQNHFSMAMRGTNMKRITAFILKVSSNAWEIRL